MYTIQRSNTAFPFWDCCVTFFAWVDYRSVEGWTVLWCDFAVGGICHGDIGCQDGVSGKNGFSCNVSKIYDQEKVIEMEVIVYNLLGIANDLTKKIEDKQTELDANMAERRAYRKENAKQWVRDRIKRKWRYRFFNPSRAALRKLLEVERRDSIQMNTFRYATEIDINELLELRNKINSIRQATHRVDRIVLDDSEIYLIFGPYN